MEIIATYALGQRVLAVQVKRIDGWTAYIDAVPGIRHSEEKDAVASHGEKLPERIAKALFGESQTLGEFVP